MHNTGAGEIAAMLGFESMAKICLELGSAPELGMAARAMIGGTILTGQAGCEGQRKGPNA